ncbi:hypothetical protein BBBOND_0109260 [Babesia bigemina]|uniref:EGF-like domain-containing protein n=1 Tax=Babesia bigemina TaxID=5866 RepID=A0A061D1W5_BABBI|nr:hypothetical protein BBBOND_0109260 [Babesia bigemina]CDR94628.1 hypothetical protein BBBOND_0109260 [Babesia bigemina]|eukprot:XP_012766814.1 hypothetical protein BBBOND_0109260 [Babesia bigemina]
MVEMKLERKKCKCVVFSCKGGKELCTDSKCETCMACCHPDCKGCEKKCKDGEKCKCLNLCCGCKENCYGESKDGTCKGKGSTDCQRCREKCKDSQKCICYQCNCGTQCNGFLCACCYFCNPGKCKREGTCDGYVIGKCTAEKGCQGHGTYDDEGRPVFGKKCECGPKGSGKDCTCYTSKRNPNDKKCRCIFGDFQKDGNCLIKCDLCGKLCSQDSYIHRGTLVVVPLAIAMVLIIVWVKYRDIIRKVFYELRGSSSRAPKHSSAYTKNLIGDRIPEESNIDRYSAIRPGTYGGLS